MNILDHLKLELANEIPRSILTVECICAWLATIATIVVVVYIRFFAKPRHNTKRANPLYDVPLYAASIYVASMGAVVAIMPFINFYTGGTDPLPSIALIGGIPLSIAAGVYAFHWLDRRIPVDIIDQSGKQVGTTIAHFTPRRK